MAEQELIAGLEAAVSAAPGNIPLRLHLVEHLIGSMRAPEGLAHCEAILRAQPDNVRAFELAAQAAATAADPRSGAFRRVATALRLVATDIPGARPAEESPVGLAAVTLPAVPETTLPAAPPAAAAPVAATAPAEPASQREPVADAPTPTAPAEKELTKKHVAPPAEPVAERPEPVSEPEPESAPEPEPDPEPAVAEFVIDPATIQRPQLGLKNIIGVADVKHRIQSTVLDPLRARRNGNGTGNGNGNGNGHHSQPRSGYLMFGPPGCGKGFFARVVAGEIGAAFLPVKLSRALDWPGDPRQNIQRIFEAAREAAPCVLFLDEVDWAGRRPDAPEDPVERGVVARLVTELETAAANRGVYVFAGADAPWDVDMALRADGRLDQTLLVLPPDEQAREAILRFHLKNRKLAGIDVNWIVQRTQHFSGDDLLLLCETAATLAAEDALGGVAAIGPGHVTRALRDVRPSAPAWFQAAVDKAITANHGGMYDDVMAYIDEHQLV